MGYQTDFIGYLQIDPPLDAHEIDVINRISGSLFVTDTGLRVADETDEAVRDILRDAPRGWSNWTVCAEGCCLAYDGGDKANHMVAWLKFLMSTLLIPGASAAASAAGMTCDHVIDGMVVGSRRDNRELYAITVAQNAVTVELLWPGNPGWSSYPPLAYQTSIDSFRDWVARRRKQRADASFSW